MPLDSDMVLVERCQQGDRAAFEMLVLKYQQQVFNLIYYLVGDSQAVEDLAQEVFYKTFKSIRSFRGLSSFYTWLYRITVNTCRNYRKARRGFFTQPLDDASERSLRPADPDVMPLDPAEELRRKELGREIVKAINSLKPDQRTILLLREVDGLSYQELAKALGCPEGTVRSRLARARQSLQVRLRHYFHPGSYLAADEEGAS